MKKTNEDYNNIIELLKKALEFYSDPKKYGSVLIPHENQPPIINDRGIQAGFALNKLKTFQDERDEQEKEFVKNLISAIESDEDFNTIMGLIETYKKETNGK